MLQALTSPVSHLRSCLQHAPARRRATVRAPIRALRRLGGELAAWKEIYDLGPTLDRIRPYSMVPEYSQIHLARLVRTVLTDGVPGDFVECGVWRGGSSFLMADLLRRSDASDRKVCLFDSFEGHRPPEEIDGEAAQEYAANTDSSEYYDNCRVSVESVQRTASALGLTGYTEIVKGWFDQTLPANAERIGKIAILRIDCDWYASVRTCLETLYDQVADGGYVIFDDYFAYDGCPIAAYELLAERRLAHRIQTDGGVGFFRKA